MNPVELRAVAPPPPPPWPLARRIGFRFVFAYVLLFALPFPLDVLPGGRDWLAVPVDKLWNAVAVWVAAHVLHLGRALPTNGRGSGDTTIGYVTLLAQVVLAASIALVWSLLECRRREHRTLHAWLHLYVRWFLVYFMFVYGFGKVIKQQFPAPGPSKLDESFGEASPMGLLWTFMGASTPYTIFAGALEPWAASS